MVLEEVKRLTKYAIRYENDFLQAVIGSTQKAAETERLVKQKALASLQARDNELGGLFERIYEDTMPVPNVTVNTRRGVYVTYEPAQNEQ